MADVEACESALKRLAARLAAVDESVRAKNTLDRSISVEVTDLGTTWHGRLTHGLLEEVSRDGTDRAQIRIIGGSDNLIAVLDGEISAAQAWAHGRIKIEAGPLDLLRLRSML